MEKGLNSAAISASHRTEGLARALLALINRCKPATSLRRLIGCSALRGETPVSRVPRVLPDQPELPRRW